MLQPVKESFGQFMGRYYAALAPTTKPLQEYVTRGLAKSIAWAPARMIDAAEDMLSLWMRSDIHDAPTRPPDMPAILVALAKDYTPTGRDYTRQVADREMVIIPTDPKERMFGLRTVAGDIRAQIAIFAMDVPTAQSLAAQFSLFLDATPNRRCTARYTFASQSMDWPVQVEIPDVPAMNIPTEAKNLTVLAIDITLRAHIPLFDAPKANEPNDGKGVPGDDANPAGYPVVQNIDIKSNQAGPNGNAANIRPYNVAVETGMARIVIQIQSTFTGYSGQSCSLFSVYDPDARVLVVSAEAPYRTERREGCMVLTNVPDITRDKLFVDADLLPAITAFYSLKNGVATDGKTPRLVFGDRASRANPSSAIEQDGVETNGPKYRISASVTCAQVAALATCLHAVHSNTIERTVQMAQAFRRLSMGEILTI